MVKNQSYTNVEEAKKKTKKSDIVLNFDKGQTVYADIYKLQEKIKEQNSSIEKIHWIFSVVVISAVVTTVLLLSDYFQFATKAYEQFYTTTKEQSIDHKTIESMATDIQSIKNTLNGLKKD